jgi:hypothetical protein
VVVVMQMVQMRDGQMHLTLEMIVHVVWMILSMDGMEQQHMLVDLIILMIVLEDVVQLVIPIHGLVVELVMLLIVMTVLVLK